MYKWQLSSTYSPFTSALTMFVMFALAMFVQYTNQSSIHVRFRFIKRQNVIKELCVYGRWCYVVKVTFLLFVNKGNITRLQFSKKTFQHKNSQKCIACNIVFLRQISSGEKKNTLKIVSRVPTCEQETNAIAVVCMTTVYPGTCS